MFARASVCVRPKSRVSKALRAVGGWLSCVCVCERERERKRENERENERERESER